MSLIPAIDIMPFKRFLTWGDMRINLSYPCLLGKDTEICWINYAGTLSIPTGDEDIREPFSGCNPFVDYKELLAIILDHRSLLLQSMFT